MEESKKRSWIKNIIIIFLAVMLVLTLFSNTIMNRSLPEVAVQYSGSGTITTQVKLSGSVVANQSKDVTLESARKVDTVYARRGDTVTRGDVLATLVAGESSEIFDLEIELKQLQIAYKQLLIESEDSLTSTKYQLEDAQKELAKLNTYMEKYPSLDKEVQGYEDKIEVLEGQIETIDKNIADLDKQLNKLSDSGYSDMSKLNDAIEDARDDVDTATRAANSAKKAMQKTLTVYNNASTAYTAAESAYNDALAIQEPIETAYTEMSNELNTLLSERDTLETEIADLEALGASATEEQIALLATKREALSAKRDEITAKRTAVNSKKTELDAAKAVTDAEYATFTEKGTAMGSAYTNYSNAASAYDSAKASQKSAEDKLESLNGGWEYSLLNTRKEEYTEQKETLTDEIADVKEKLDEVKADITKTDEEAADEKVKLERDIEGYETAIRIAEANGEIEDETDALTLQMKRTEMERKQKEISKLKESATSTQITAPVSGTIESINITDGEEVEKDTVVFSITLKDKGYTMECSVTNAQAARLNVGQEAEVQYYYWGDKPTVRISAIKNDTGNPGKSKIVTFAVEGDISDGTNLTVTVGNQGSSYDTIVPNSAIREDSNGKFVLLVISKSSPLGNRYYAERKDVTVLSSDSTKSAIDASLSWGDYVITSSSVPISDGMQVRMSE